MSTHVEGENRHQSVPIPDFLDHYMTGDSAVRVIDVFVENS